ncbi:MAG: D-arginine dehydrogenase [Patiriisocius sp.]|jgi:D-arginine dehydrogenase
MTAPYDVVVIGAGIAGVSLAAELATDCRVALIEAEKQPGMHSTGRSAAYFAPSYGNEVVRQLTRESEAYFTSPDHQVPLLKNRPALFIGRDHQQDSILDLQREQPVLQQLNFAELIKLVPVLHLGQVSSGLLDIVGGDLDVDAILQGYLRSFKQSGGKLITGFSAEFLKHKNGLWKVKGKTAEVSAPMLVNSAGAWADTVAAKAGVNPLGLTPKRRTAILVDGDDAWANWPLTIDIDEGFYFKPDAGQLLISPADETSSEPCDAQPEELDIAIAIDRVQQIADIPVRRVNHKWAGLRTFAPDKSFVIGFDPRATGFFWCAGQGGYGVQSAPGVARLAKQLCLGNDVDNAHIDLVTLVAPDRLI